MTLVPASSAGPAGAAEPPRREGAAGSLRSAPLRSAPSLRQSAPSARPPVVKSREVLEALVGRQPA
eukprot:CAMPEP_0118892346 /NCGR_PEP_ID=MMETSP1166-20130328/1983_1 /TAXON_ID=1104430 /ORGANISM="Chrysoreinhardia sp, Strain CCMP3193" /LENGTH=65 /DNA_ID=CAMNT_0006831061 /DNA_START=359 /DNA_END=556 /DNA_ORIENTATION=-